MIAKVVIKEAFKGVGYVKTVTFEEAQAKALHGIIHELKEKAATIPHVTNLEGLWALSHPVTKSGFTFYILAEVSQFAENLPIDMVTYELPALTYATCHHEKGQNIAQSYTNLFTWIDEQGYTLNQKDVTHLEWYPMDQDTNKPHFDIWLPILEESKI